MDLPEQQDLTVWCVLSGSWPNGERELGEKYVRVLRDAFATQLKTPHKFKCLSDADVKDIETVVDVELPQHWWSKVWLFKYATEGRNLVFDLDMLLVGSMDQFVENLRGTPIAMQQDLSRRQFSCSIMYWEGNHSDVFAEWDKQGRPLDYGRGGKYDDSETKSTTGGMLELGADNAWVEHMRPDCKYIQDLNPGTIVSFKWEAQNWDAPHTNTPVVCFHKLPRPHEVKPDNPMGGSWVPVVWQETSNRGCVDYSLDLTIWCSLTGAWPNGDRKLGEAYVHILRDMVYRNLFAGPSAKKYPFKCLTDMPIEGIDCVVEKDAPVSWWNKMWLFKHATTGRNLYFDLDTVVTGRLEEFVEKLRGTSFTTLRDLGNREMATTGVFYWEGDQSDIYNEWTAADQAAFMATADNWKDRNGVGDGAWFAKMRPKAPWLQTLLPTSTIASYKWSQIHYDWPTEVTAVVCFHGIPRPHQIVGGWVPKIWCLGGLARPSWKTIVNTKHGKLLENIAANRKRPDIQFADAIAPEQPADKALLICGGGPSIGDKDYIDNIKLWKNMGHEMWALNGTYNFLQTQGIVPDGMVMMDARLQNIKFIENPHGKTTFYLGTTCDPVMFEKLSRYRVVGWNPAIEGLDAPLQMGGGSSVGSRALSLGYAKGYRKFHLYGYDSSYRLDAEGKTEGHAFQQDLNKGELEVYVTIHEREFHCARWMAKQCEELRDLVKTLTNDYGCEFHVFGDGLFPYAIALDSEDAQPEQASTPESNDEAVKEMQ
jgi:hypothetical protein